MTELLTSAYSETFLDSAITDGRSGPGRLTLNRQRGMQSGIKCREHSTYAGQSLAMTWKSDSPNHPSSGNYRHQLDQHAISVGPDAEQPDRCHWWRLDF